MQARPQIVAAEVIRLLSEERQRLGLSMKGVADKAGISHTMVSRMERGLRNPTLDTLLRISGAMGIELSPIVRQAEAVSPFSTPPQG